MNVQNISSAPPYISKFINHNFTKLIEIYDGGIKEFGTGVLSFKCSDSENKMDDIHTNREFVPTKDISDVKHKHLELADELSQTILKDVGQEKINKLNNINDFNYSL